ncbi:MAG TPA: hypothetical protein VI669_18035 [Vicinamibacteria bacterium]
MVLEAIGHLAGIARKSRFVVVIDIFSPPVRSFVAMRARAEWHTGEE